MYTISKEFDFCYGHRVWSQKLSKELSLNAECKCKHLHGHNGKIQVELEAYRLNNQGMVLDFTELNFVKKFIDETIDHKFIIDENDPVKDLIIPRITYDQMEAPLLLHSLGAFKIVDIPVLKEAHELDETDDVKIELYESFVIVNFVPTSENICRWIYDIVSKKLESFDIQVKGVRFFETPKTQSYFCK